MGYSSLLGIPASISTKTTIIENRTVSEIVNNRAQPTTAAIHILNRLGNQYTSQAGTFSDLLTAEVSDFGFKIISPDTITQGISQLQGRARVPNSINSISDNSIKELSSILVDKFNGEVPESFLELEKLPGVGHKTASVVMSQGFNHPAFPVDTHIHRLSQRWGLTSGKNVVQTEKDLKLLFPQKTWNKLHLQIIFYGREFCTARSCYGIQCQICTKCYPNRKKAFIAKKP